VIPLVRRTAQALAQWLAEGDDLALEPDLDAIEALADERESLWRRVTAAPFLTDAEKREAVGYATSPSPPGEVPRRGEWGDPVTLSGLRFHPTRRPSGRHPPLGGRDEEIPHALPRTLVEAVLQRGDLAHLALLAWASGASALLVTTFRELASANRRFDAFVRELALFNRRHMICDDSVGSRASSTTAAAPITGPQSRQD
jgi:hypothetical protein